MARQPIIILLLALLVATVLAQGPGGGGGGGGGGSTTNSRASAGSAAASASASATGGLVNGTIPNNGTVNASNSSIIPSPTSASLLPSPTGNVTSGNSTEVATDRDKLILDTKVDATFGVLGVLLIISGLPMGFWGGRNRWSSYFLTGTYLGALVVMVLVLRFGVEMQENDPSSVIRGLFLLACIVGGIVCGGAAVIAWKATRFVVGAGGGFTLSLFILSLHNNILIPSIGLRYILVVGLSAVGFVLATIPKIAIPVTCISTAMMGSAAVVLGIDCFTTGGLKEYWVYILGFKGMFPRLQGYFPLTVVMQAELGVMAALFIMGSAIQWRLLEVIYKKARQLKQQDNERRMVEDAAAYRQSMALDTDLAAWEKHHGRTDSQSAPSPSLPDPDRSRKNSSQFSLLPWHTRTRSGAGTDLAYPPGAMQSKRTTMMSQSSGGPAYAAVASRPSEDLLSPKLGEVGTGWPRSDDVVLAKGPGNNKESSDDIELEEKMKTLEEVKQMRASIDQLRAELSEGGSTHARVNSQSSAGALGGSTRFSSTDSRPKSALIATHARGLSGGEIDFEKYKNDRTLFRPPGTPASYTNSGNSAYTTGRPLSISLGEGLVAGGSGEPGKERERRKSTTVDREAVEQYRRNSTADYFAPQSNDPSLNSTPDTPGQFYTPQLIAETPVPTDNRRHSRALLDFNEPSDALGRPLPLEDQEKLRVERVRRASLGAERKISGTREPAPRPVEAKRKSVMSIEELEARHRQTMRELQGPVTQQAKAEAQVADAKAKWDRQEAAKAAKVREEEKRAKEEKRKSRVSLSGMLPTLPTAGGGSGSNSPTFPSGSGGDSGSSGHQRQQSRGGAGASHARGHSQSRSHSRSNSLGRQLDRAAQAQRQQIQDHAERTSRHHASGAEGHRRQSTGLALERLAREDPSKRSEQRISQYLEQQQQQIQQTSAAPQGKKDAASWLDY